MKMLVIYDSVFGNTQEIALTIAAELETTAVPLGDVTPEILSSLDGCVFGSPTRGFRPTEGITKLLKGLPNNHLANIKAAAFDTRILLDTINSKVMRFLINKGGYAAKKISKTLQKKRAILVTEPEGFLVTGEQGPLKAGELERAAAWAKDIAQKAKAG
jgi:flavodoxin